MNMTTQQTPNAAPNQTPPLNTGDPQVPETPPEPVVTPVKYSGEPEELKKLLEKVRKEEKQKLYPQIDHLKGQMTALLREKEDLMKAIEIKDAEVRSKATEKLSEVEKIQVQLSELKQQNAELVAKQRLIEEEARKQQEKMRLESYRVEAIRAAGNALIPEMVTGNTETEIDEAIIKSKRKYAEIKAQMEAMYKTNLTATPVPGMTNPPANPSGQPSDRQEAEEITAEQIADMQDEDWAKNRLDIRRAADRSMKNFFQGSVRK
jgi:DNA repair exonuclease SbcCD ATPase subunit